MSNINHEAAREWAKRWAEQDDMPIRANLCRAYLGLDAQLEAERQRVKKLEELVQSCAELNKYARPKVSQGIIEVLTSIMEGRNNG